MVAQPSDIEELSKIWADAFGDYDMWVCECVVLDPKDRISRFTNFWPSEKQLRDRCDAILHEACEDIERQNRIERQFAEREARAALPTEPLKFDRDEFRAAMGMPRKPDRRATAPEPQPTTDWPDASDALLATLTNAA